MGLHAYDLSARAGDRELFTGVSLSVETGEVVSVRGPSGSGKTLLLRQLAGLDPLPSGTLTLNGETPASLGAPRWRKQVTYVAQEAPPLPGSGREFFEQARRFASWGETDDPVAIAAKWGIEEALWTQRYSTLSGGERQRIYLAIALASRPTVLLLDEPTSHLDADSARAVEHTLAGVTGVWVTHDERQAERVGGRVVDLRDGGASG